MFETKLLRRSARDDPPEIHWPPAEIPDVDLPEAFDWRDHGAVTDVKNQVESTSCSRLEPTNNVYTTITTITTETAI